MKIMTNSEHDEIISLMNKANDAIKKLNNDNMQLEIMYNNLSSRFKELVIENNLYKDEILILLNEKRNEKTSN